MSHLLLLERIRETKTRHVQTILDRAAHTDRFNITTLRHLKSFLSGIFRLGGQLGYCEGNPAREASRPQGQPTGETIAYSHEEVLRMVDAVPEPAATMIATAAFSGPSLNVCVTCNKAESEHGRETHKFERNKSLPESHGWHAFRRGLATNLHRLGVDDKTIQAILRHSNVAVTQACYIKTLPQSSVEAMQKLESALTATQLPPKQTAAITKVAM